MPPAESTSKTGPSPSTNGQPITRNGSRKGAKSRKPNYGLIHKHPLPIEIYPLPPLIPHNPISLLTIAFTYLGQLLWPPTQPVYRGYFSSATSSIHVTDEQAAKALWEMGFFGKGSLSRSEPTWLARAQMSGVTSEQVTGKRRNERKAFKLERARQEQDIIQQKLKSDTAVNGTANGLSNPVIAGKAVGKAPDTPVSGQHAVSSLSSEQSLQEEDRESKQMADIDSVLAKASGNGQLGTANALDLFLLPDGHNRQIDQNTSSAESQSPTSSAQLDGFIAKRQTANGIGKSVRFSPTIEAREFDLSSPTMSPLKHPGPSPLAQQVDVPETSTKNQEHYELSLEEAFFLVYALGTLQIFCDGSDIVLDSVSLLALFRRHSYFPPRSVSIAAEPDDPFLISYVVYHHFRSLGWVVRSGVKFSVDYLLYNRGPVFSHAEFAVVVIPAYSDPYWSETGALRSAVGEKTARSWSWLHGVNRVQSQVRKALILVYVDVPAPVQGGPKTNATDIGAMLSRYRVREIMVKRWTPNRSRD